MSRSVAATIVLADDDEADRMLTRRALRKAAIGNEVLEVSDGPALMRRCEVKQSSQAERRWTSYCWT